MWFVRSYRKTYCTPFTLILSTHPSGLDHLWWVSGCKWGHGGILANFCQCLSSSPHLLSVLIFTLTWNLSQAVLAQREITVDLVPAGPMISTLKLLFISEKLPEHQAREKVWNSTTNLESSGQTDSVRLSRCLIIWGLELCQGLSSTGLIWKERETYWGLQRHQRNCLCWQSATTKTIIFNPQIREVTIWQ